MQVSVVIPMYNAASTIVTCIESCLSQSVSVKEIIVVDDASTDESSAMVEAHFGNKVSLIKLSENAGPSIARNAGWDRASGDYVAFLDSDDAWLPEKIALCIAALRPHPDCLLLWHDYEVKGTKLHPKNLPELETTSFFRLLRGNVVSTSCVLIKRSVPNRFNGEMRYCEDYDLALQLAQEGQVLHLPAVLTFINRPVLSPGGLSSNKWKMRQGELSAYFNVAKRKPVYFLALPLLHTWSILKHFRGMLR